MESKKFDCEKVLEELRLGFERALEEVKPVSYPLWNIDITKPVGYIVATFKIHGEPVCCSSSRYGAQLDLDIDEEIERIFKNCDMVDSCTGCSCSDKKPRKCCVCGNLEEYAEPIDGKTYCYKHLPKFAKF